MTLLSQSLVGSILSLPRLRIDNKNELNIQITTWGALQKDG